MSLYAYKQETGGSQLQFRWCIQIVQAPISQQQMSSRKLNWWRFYVALSVNLQQLLYTYCIFLNATQSRSQVYRYLLTATPWSILSYRISLGDREWLHTVPHDFREKNIKRNLATRFALQFWHLEFTRKMQPAIVSNSLASLRVLLLREVCFQRLQPQLMCFIRCWLSLASLCHACLHYAAKKHIINISTPPFISTLTIFCALLVFTTWVRLI